MKKLVSLMAAAGLLLTAASIGLIGCRSTDHHESGHVHTYTCRHHPEVVQNNPGTCPKCGMKLVHKE